MPKFMVEATYTVDGLRGLQRDKASGRREAVTAALQSLGGRLDAMYYALGESDVVVIADVPDHVTAAAMSLAVSASGVVRTRTRTLLTVEEADQALAKSVEYRPPGG